MDNKHIKFSYDVEDYKKITIFRLKIAFALILAYFFVLGCVLAVVL